MKIFTFSSYSVLLLASAAATAPYYDEALGCWPVSVEHDATYCIDGPICSGSGPSPAGSLCPVKGDVAIADCHSYLESYGSGDKCVLPVDATCQVIKTGAWGCVLSGNSYPTPAPTKYGDSYPTPAPTKCDDSYPTPASTKYGDSYPTPAPTKYGNNGGNGGKGNNGGNGGKGNNGGKGSNGGKGGHGGNGGHPGNDSSASWGGDSSTIGISVAVAGTEAASAGGVSAGVIGAIAAAAAAVAAIAGVAIYRQHRKMQKQEQQSTTLVDVVTP